MESLLLPKSIIDTKDLTLFCWLVVWLMLIGGEKWKEAREGSCPGDQLS